jgi:hypothetical protein
MKKFLKFVGVLAGLAVLVVVLMIALTPWMDRWGATDEEIAALFPGDELVPEPASFVNRAITINAAPEYIYPWIVQLDATKGGWYSYTWLEAMLNCKMVNADRIHLEWQNLQVGDEVKMCPGEFSPPPYIVAQIRPDQAIVMGHQENGKWVDLYQFVIVPQTDSTSRLILRTRTMMVGGIWTVIHPGAFIMERGMLHGIKERAERLAQTGNLPPLSEITPIPEVFIPLDKAIPDYGITLEGVHLDVAGVVLDKSFPAGCTGDLPACTPAQKGLNMLSVTFEPRDLPEGDMLAYKSLPPVSVAMEGGTSVSYSLTKYDNTSYALTLGFEVPDDATVFGLHWADLVEIPLTVATANP